MIVRLGGVVFWLLGAGSLLRLFKTLGATVGTGDAHGLSGVGGSVVMAGLFFFLAYKLFSMPLSQRRHSAPSDAETADPPASSSRSYAVQSLIGVLAIIVVLLVTAFAIFKSMPQAAIAENDERITTAQQPTHKIPPTFSPAATDAGAPVVSTPPTSSTREFLDNHRATFSTKGHPKAKGVYFTMEYPASWVASEGNRPHIVQKIVSNGGRGFEMVMILCGRPLPPGAVITEQERRELLSPSVLRSVLPEGAIFVDAKSTRVEGMPAGIIEYKMNTERLGVAVSMQTWAISFFSGDNLVQIQFHVAGPGGPDANTTSHMAQFKPLFTLMANSIVLPDKWVITP